MTNDTKVSGNFMVTSHGWSGSNWFADALNRHPKVLCTHSVTNEVPSVGDGYSPQQADDMGRLQRLRGRQDETLEQHFDGLRAKGRAEYYGSVHRYRIRDLVSLVKGPAPAFSLSNQVRHPVKLVHSGTGQLTDMVETEVYTRAEVMNFFSKFYPYYEYIAKRHHLNLADWEVLSFLAACSHMRVLAQELWIMKKQFPRSQIILMERLTSDRTYFSQTVKRLTGDDFDISEQYLDDVFSIGKLNKHAQGGFDSASDQYSAWPDWKREAFSDLAAEAAIVTPYTSVGYDFSFLEPSPLGELRQARGATGGP